MHNQILDSHSELFVQGFYRDHEEAITLIGHDERTPDFIETPYGSNPDSIRYHIEEIEIHTFHVTGFAFQHPHGATITVQFAEPILGLKRTLATDGMELDDMSYESDVEKAILARLGRISSLREVNLI